MSTISKMALAAAIACLHEGRQRFNSMAAGRSCLFLPAEIHALQNYANGNGQPATTPNYKLVMFM